MLRLSCSIRLVNLVHNWIQRLTRSWVIVFFYSWNSIFKCSHILSSKSRSISSLIFCETKRRSLLNTRWSWRWRRKLMLFLFFFILLRLNWFFRSLRVNHLKTSCFGLCISWVWPVIIILPININRSLALGKRFHLDICRLAIKILLCTFNNWLSVHNRISWLLLFLCFCSIFFKHLSKHRLHLLQ